MIFQRCEAAKDLAGSKRTFQKIHKWIFKYFCEKWHFWFTIGYSKFLIKLIESKFNSWQVLGLFGIHCFIKFIHISNLIFRKLLLKSQLRKFLTRRFENDSQVLEKNQRFIIPSWINALNRFPKDSKQKNLPNFSKIYEK